jgi:hypothetical protein
MAVALAWAKDNAEVKEVVDRAKEAASCISVH